MNTEKILPFNWKNWDESDTLRHIYYECEFTDDFGVIKQGKYDDVIVDYGQGTVEVYKGDDVIYTQRWIAIPIED